MSTPTDIIVHSKLYKVGGQAYWEDQPITEEQFVDLYEHYQEVQARLGTPWLTKDDERDSMGRVNPSLTGERHDR